MHHPFDRYSAYTDVAALKEFSGRPLRKCMRVNTSKLSIADFEKHAKEQKWNLQPVPWCKEGFFVDRKDRSVPLGKDLLHVLGYTYMQEASSMLPVAMLDPRPGEKILDMAAAPGSKSTQIVARLRGKGFVVCNDMQEMRLKTLREALRRLSCITALVTKRKGQWFGKHMVGRFDKVLIDAPCTGQGTVRKDKSALQYCSLDSIGKNAKLQRELIESAVHATKIGGRIVYSTCTLTPEENEEVVLSILRKYPEQLEAVDPRTIPLEGREWNMDKAIEDSMLMQKDLSDYTSDQPMLRIWPQTYDSEGFFCAVLKKIGPTAEPLMTDLVKPREEIIPRSREKQISNYLVDHFGMDPIGEDEMLVEHDGRYLLTSKAIFNFKLPTPNVGLGLPFGKKIASDPVLLDHDFLTLRGSSATKHIIELTDEEWKEVISGKDIACSEELFGHIAFKYNGICVGRGRAKNGKCKNQLPRWMITISN
ncbi:NOL1/NOP2/sun family putative RNA methylase [Candidatus Peregrinibacteria bacterium]|nr:NOL1/NOP2/sun family putative RNA methylase [Candidatus Peregrinibacteria bacterium]